MESTEDLFNEFVTQNISNEEAEKNEAELLVEKGFVFNVGKRKFQIKPLVFGTITYANKHAVDLKINLTTEDNASVFNEVGKNVSPLMKFIAVCILHKRWKILLFTNILSWYLKWKLNPQMALKISMVILNMYDIKNFITSIRMIGQLTITSPKSPKETTLVDGNQQVSNQSTEP
ncbi:hypothetical protein [Chryseobacterium sp. JV274]|uniref:hypothetical protein n=1 Tax=Chryseobacterium sp. JV274 TaxID=1932669 RepID=UPI00098486FC|nr:hypothetical protein [Chryseobacterium sp. JV274]